MPAGWESFYLLIGGAAGALIGLLFVVITLTSELEPKGGAVGSKVYVSATVFHFAIVFLVSAAALMPDSSGHVMGIATGATGLLGIAYSLLSVFRLARRLPTVPHWSDWFYYGV